MPSLRLSIAFSLTACVYAAVTFGQPAQAPPPGPPSTPPWQTATPWPDRIVVTVAEDPKTSFSVSWRTNAGVAGARAEIAVAGDEARFDVAATAIDAISVRPDLQTKTVGEQSYPLRWNSEIEPPAYHSVTFTGLAPDTLYAYRVQGAEGHWSEWLQTRTAPASAEPFRFLYFGDAQDGISSHWPRVVRAAFATAPDARFAIHAGDLVNWGSRDFEWAAWFKSVGFIHGMIPAVPVVGNHEYFDGIVGPGGTQVTALSVLWRPQFALPEVAALPEALTETVYSFEYGDTVVVVLDTMAEQHFAAQAAWLDTTLAASDATWKIVTMHHPLFELLERSGIAGAGETGPERRAVFLPVLARHGVDLVLQGHDHSYGRGATMTRRTPNAARAGNLGAVFVTSSAGAKMYNIADEGWSAFAEQGAVLQRTAENTPFFQVIAVDGDVLRYEARTATGRLYDAFRLLKPRSGPNRLEALPTDFDAERTFDNTGGNVNGRYDVVPTRPAP
jgi:3',5'-cyclic AMP phosphodiesterase CpdA